MPDSQQHIFQALIEEETQRKVARVRQVNKRVSEMLLRILVFADRFPQLFAKPSPAVQLLEQLQGFVRKLPELGTAQASGKGDAKVSTEKRFIARQALKSHLYAISRTAAGTEAGRILAFARPDGPLSSGNITNPTPVVQR